MTHRHTHQHVSGQKLTWTILLNIAITAAEFIGGLLTGYLALLADAVHNLSDVASLVLAWLGVKASRLPATKKSTYGFMRVEVMTALISAVALVVIAVFICIEAYDRLVDPRAISRPGVFMTVAVIGLLGNFFSIWLLHSERGKSLNMKSAFLHMAYDTLSSVAVIIGGVIIILTGRVIIDAVLSGIIALMILWSSYGVIREAVMILLEAVPPGIDFDRVYETILDCGKVTGVHDLHIWSLSSEDTALSCHICVKDDDYRAGPEIIDAINVRLNDEYGINHSTVQVGTGDCPRPDLLCCNRAHEKG